MMSIVLSVFMLIPLSFMAGFWLNQFAWFMVTWLFIYSFSSTGLFLNLSFELGMDMMSYLLILLSLWICSLMIMSSMKIYVDNNWWMFFVFNVCLLGFFLLLTFSSMNMFIFYIFFEASLIPTFILIVGWGYQPERLQAGLYLLFYTLFASLPMMISLFSIYNDYMSFYLMFFDQVDSLMIYFLINTVFFVKIPMFFVHLWLPKAHVEAPVAGSMILAGIMLKLGGYGLLRFMVIFMKFGLTINFMIVGLSLVGGLMVSLICMRQSDMKSLIAYSSVAHMGLVLAGIMSFSYWGLVGSLVLMLAHGLCSSGLFFLSNIVYERVGSRSLYFNKGLINFMPNLSMFWFLFCACNMASPPSLNLLGEIILINSIIAYSKLSMIILFFISFFGAAYSLYLYSFSQHGLLYSGSYSFSLCSIREYLILMLHWLPLNLMFLAGDLFSIWL